MRRKVERSTQGQTNNKAKQHSTPKAKRTVARSRRLLSDLECEVLGLEAGETVSAVLDELI